MQRLFARVKVWSLVMVLACLLVPGLAWAQRPAVQVVAFDSDEASEDQADALTASFRSRVRNTPGWQLTDTNASLSMLLPALKCPPRPDAACLQRIGDQLKTDRFFWGTVNKASVSHQVVAELHLWQRGKAEQVAKETYSDNLKDQNDEALRRIAAQLFERLSGQASQGTLIVKLVGAENGTVLVDGKPAGQADHGQATLLLTAGAHQIDVQVGGMISTAQGVTVLASGQTEVSIALHAGAGPPPVEPSKPFPVRKVIAFSAIGVGLAAGVVSGVLGALWASGTSDWNNYKTTNGLTESGMCSGASHTQYLAALGPALDTACNKARSAATDGTISWITGAAAGAFVLAGVVLLVTDHKKEGSGSDSGAAFRVLPSFGPGMAGVNALLTF